ncbi:MAG: hypothetical protein BRC51_12740 [Cyanobacteria bacterium SW_12_48_29]|nr:MAG: hypothetical protein BRC51_12740 [Cyanobacteria bacterium SW_12_48_29]
MGFENYIYSYIYINNYFLIVLKNCFFNNKFFLVVYIFYFPRKTGVEGIYCYLNRFFDEHQSHKSRTVMEKSEYMQVRSDALT